jgi:hypothetical protein
MKQNITDNYVKAFVAVAEILEPQVKFNNVHQTEGRMGREVTVSGKRGNELIVVSTEQHETKGLQIVSTRYGLHNMKILSKKSVWYFSFNWKGIMNSEGDIF